MTANLDMASVTDHSMKCNATAWSALPDTQSIPDALASPTLFTIHTHHRKLRQSTLCQWLNYHLPNAMPITFAQLADGKALVHLVASMSNTAPPSTNQSGMQNIQLVLDMLHYWRDIPLQPVLPEAVVNGDPDAIFHLLSVILTHYQVHIIHSLQDSTFAFIRSHVHSLIPNHASVMPADIQQVMLAWCNAALADYINASLLPAVRDCGNSWQNGLYFLALLHYYDPKSVDDLYNFILLSQQKSLWHSILQTAFTRAHSAFQIPLLLDPDQLSETDSVDQDSVTVYLTEFSRAVSASSNLTQSDIHKRTADIEQWLHLKNTTTISTNEECLQQTLPSTPPTHESLSASEQTLTEATSHDQETEEPYIYHGTTVTTTITAESIRLVKTTKVSESQDPIYEFEARVSHVLEKITQLHTRLGLIVPTRSSNYHATTTLRTPSSATPDALLESWDESDSFVSSVDSQTRVLHPLQASQEDVLTYRRNFEAFQVALDGLRRDDVEPLFQFANDLGLTVSGPTVTRRMEQINKAIEAIENDMTRADCQLNAFQLGFSFADMCASVKSELDLVQLTMVKAIVSAPVIDDMERRVGAIATTVTHIAERFQSLLEQPDYQRHYDALVACSHCVTTWVGEVRQWFTEAERIRQWVDARQVTLESMQVPEPLATVEFPISPEQVDQLNTIHEALEKEIDAFEKEDMARLRSHVKPLTGDRAGKELSPADTTTIEITLTTLTTLDRLMQRFRKKSNTLQTLTFRMRWEKELAACLTWISDTDKSLENFIRTSSRWRPDEDDFQGAGHDASSLRDQLLAKERIRELIIQKLLLFERTISDFESGQYSATVDAYNALFDVTEVDLPNYLEDKQTDLEVVLDALKQRRAFAREIVEQRLQVMEFTYQVHLIHNDAHQLLSDLGEARDNARPEDNDRDMVGRVQVLNEQIAQVISTTAGRIPYPAAPNPADEADNAASNEAIRQVVYAKHAGVIQLSETLDLALAELNQVLQLHRHGRQLMEDAKRLKAWAEERLRLIRKSKVDVDGEVPGLEEWQRLDRERRNMLDKLKGGKERDAIKVLTDIQILLETIDKDHVVSMDKQELLEISQELTEVYDALGAFLNQHEQDLKTLRKKMEDGQSYAQSLQQLKTYINQTRASLPGIMQSYGFITGQSEEQDRRRHGLLNEVLAKLIASHKVHYDLVTRLKDHLNVDEDTGDEHAALEKDWSMLSKEMDQLKLFTDRVGTWYDRQRRLSVVESALMAGLNDEISQMAKSGWNNKDVELLEGRVQEILDELKDIGDGIALTDTTNDPLEAANYSCARDRHTALSHKAQSALNNLNTLRKNTRGALVVSAFLGKADALLKRLQQEKEKVNGRIAAIGGTHQLAQQTMATLQETCKAMQAASKQAESGLKDWQMEIHKLSQEARLLSKQGYDEQTVEEPIEHLRTCFDQLVAAIALERRQGAFVRKLLIHAKAYQEVNTWIVECGKAIAKLPTDVCEVEETELLADIDLVERRIATMQPTITAFHEMPKRILTKEGQPLDVYELQFDAEEVKQDIQVMQDHVSSAWNALLQKMKDIHKAVERSARDADITRKINEILTTLGHFKDSVDGITVGNRDDDDDDDDNYDTRQDDATFIGNCSLSHIPIDRELLSIKTALESLETDMNHFSQAKISELDSIFKSDSDSETTFSDQRTQIATAAEDLTNTIKNKRDAIAMAENMEPFLVVVEELEVLLSAVGEVIDRASPEYARLVDGVASRTDLQTMLIDLDTRYWYYEPKINDLITEAKGAARYLTKDKRVEACLSDMARKWAELRDLAAKKRELLLDRIGSLDDVSIQSRLQSFAEKRQHTLAKRASTSSLNGIAPRPMQSTPRAAFGRPQTSMATRTPTRTPGGLPSRPASARELPPIHRRLTRLTPTKQRLPKKSPESYVADPQNDLDVALGDIINDSPYKVRVKMMPGSVGKYWFGDVNPKLAYCRILRSRMVMVRVGGGWMELSQFLRDHALLESGNFVGGRAIDPQPTTGKMVVGSGPAVTIRGGGGVTGKKSLSMSSKSSPRESLSTPFRRSSTQSYGHGIKEGDKFLVPVDEQGNRVEVRMTKANSRTTKFTTPRRSYMVN